MGPPRPGENGPLPLPLKTVLPVMREGRAGNITEDCGGDEGHLSVNDLPPLDMDLGSDPGAKLGEDELPMPRLGVFAELAEPSRGDMSSGGDLNDEGIAAARGEANLLGTMGRGRELADVDATAFAALAEEVAGLVGSASSSAPPAADDDDDDDEDDDDVLLVSPHFLPCVGVSASPGEEAAPERTEAKVEGVPGSLLVAPSAAAGGGRATIPSRPGSDSND